MSRYIDADALKLPDEYQIDPFDDPYYRGIGNGWNIALKECRERIDSAPTVSPDEVRGEGKWIERVDYDWDIYHECSVCHTPFTMLDGTTPELNDYHYCPNCGVKMEVSE